MSARSRRRSLWVSSAMAGAVACSVAQADSTWTTTGGGNWGTATNWAGGVPNGSGVRATFGGAIIAPSVINQNVAGLTLGAMIFNNTNGYTIGGTGASNTITIDVA